MWKISVLETLDSTQRYMRECLDRAPDMAQGMVVRTEVQTGGYGRYGRAWQSAPGDLAFSFLLKPERALREWGTLSLVVGIALRRCGDGAGMILKWPNDVLSGGRKCAGILCEVEQDSVIIGIGVNLTDKDNVAFSKFETEQGAHALMMQFLHEFDGLYRAWQHNGFAALKADWLALAHPRGAALSVKQGDQVLHGTFEDIGDDGALLFKDEKGAIKTITAGELTIGSV